MVFLFVSNNCCTVSVTFFSCLLLLDGPLRGTHPHKTNTGNFKRLNRKPKEKSRDAIAEPGSQIIIVIIK